MHTARLAPLCLICAASLAALSCVGMPRPQGAPSTEPPSAAAVPGADAASPAELDALLAQADRAREALHPVEAIRALVSVLALSDGRSEPALASRAAQARAELTRIGARLTLEPGEGWIKDDGAQAEASTRGLGRVGSLQPLVYLYENYGAVKTPVADAPIRFHFVKGAGQLVESVSTDGKGRANTSINRLDEAATGVLIRAMPVFTEKGYTYAFEEVRRDFVYLPASNVARVAAVESGPSGSRPARLAADQMAIKIREAGFDPAIYDGALDDSRFAAAMDGELATLRLLARETGAAWFLLLHSNASAPRQMVVSGKAYNIFTSDASASLRLVRDDGTVAWTRPLDGLRGQGGTPEAAVEDAFVRARTAAAAALSDERSVLAKALLAP